MQVKKSESIKKCYWQDIREVVNNIDPKFTKLVDALSPGKKFPLYIAKYQYGDLIADTKRFFLPKPDGSGVADVADSIFPDDIRRNLQFGSDSMPFGMVLDKKIEYYIDLPEEHIVSPNRMFGPGRFFPLGRILNFECNRRYSANSVLIATAGARSAFMLPSIGCVNHHNHLQNDYQVRASAAKSMYDHWPIFKEITKSRISHCDWHASLLLFSDSWEEKLYHDKAWQELRLYLYRLGWEDSEYYRNNIYYDVAFSGIQQKRNLRPNPYLVDTARYLFATATGAVPGYRPAIDEAALPVSLVQKAFVESYGLKKYTPIIMEPDYFYFEDSNPVYYSLQNPSTPIFAPKSRQVTNTLFELRELAHIMNIFVDEFSREHAMCSESIIGEISTKVDFTYYHNKQDRHKIISPSSEIVEFDPNFIQSKNVLSQATFCSDAKFLRGCIGIKKKADITD